MRKASKLLESELPSPELLKRQLSAVRPYFDVCRVCLGEHDEEMMATARQHNAEVHVREWDDNYSAQDNVLLRLCRNGDWVMIMDSDEVPSKALLENLRDLIHYAETNGYNMISMPSLLSVDGWFEYSLEVFLNKQRRGEIKPFRKYWLFRYATSVRSYGKTHRLVSGASRWQVFNQPYPYYHFKTSNGFIIMDCLHAAANPKGHTYTYEQALELRAALPKQLRVSRDVARWLESNGSSLKFEQFVERYSFELQYPISRWFMWYYFLLHPEQLRGFNWRTDPRLLKFLAIKLYFSDGDITKSRMPEFVKKKLFEAGWTSLKDVRKYETEATKFGEAK